MHRKLHYFGPWDNPKAALEKLNHEWPYRSEGRTHPPANMGDGCTLQLLCDAFLNSKRGKLESGELSERSFRKLLNSLDINSRKGLGFYTLRHTFETLGGESQDQVAVNALMGHVDSSMAGLYRERISDERLQAVTDMVWAWLWPPD